MLKHGKMSNSGRKKEPGIWGRGQNEGVTVFSERGRERGRAIPRDNIEVMKNSGARRQEQELSPEGIHKLEKSTDLRWRI